MKVISKIDSSIVIDVMHNGYSLSKNGVTDSPLDLIEDVAIRACVRAEAHLLTFKSSTLYMIIGNDGLFGLWQHHTQAFNHCQKSSKKVKGVYRVIGLKDNKLELGGLNCWGGLHSNSNDHDLLKMNTHKLIDFKVI